MTKLIFGAAFVAGLAIVGWVGSGYLGGHTLALAVTLLIAVCYLAGSWELLQYRRATRALSNVLQGLKDSSPSSLDDWLPATLPAGLRVAVRQRIEGQRAGLPGPVLATYLTGLLVLLGMLGTFLGMVVTLHGTGAALLGAEGLQAIRDALSAPVHGLGLAFGTSVAGVGTSAALGLMAAMARRERLQAAHTLDAAMAASLRPFTPQHQRETSLRLMEQQAQMMPELVERMGTFMDTLERQQAALSERLVAEQARFHADTESAYTGLAASVERTLLASAGESARHAGQVIEPAVQAALSGLASQSAELQARQAELVRAQLDGLASRFGEATATVASQWNEALATHQKTSQSATQALQAALDGFTHSFENRSTALADGLAQRLEQQAQALARQWGEALALQARHHEQLTTHQQEALQAATRQAHGSHAELQERMAAQDEARQAAWEASLRALSSTLQTEWQQTGERSAAQWQGLGDMLTRTAESINQQLEAQAQGTLGQISTLMQTAAEAPRAAAAMMADLKQAQIELQSQAAAQDEVRQAAWTSSLQSLATSLQDGWKQAGERTAAQWQSVGEALTRSSEEITRQLETQARNTLGEISTLVQAASEAPRAAAEVIGELRQKLSDSMVRDNEMLEERSRILQTLSTLLDAVNHASVEQRSAIDALVSTTSELMERAGARFGETLEAQSERIDTAAAQLTGSAVEVASLGEAFGAGVLRFGEVNEQLIEQLQRIESALSKSLTRSDEQLDYYVAQAREVIELSTGAQTHIIDGLRQLAAERQA